MTEGAALVATAAGDLAPARLGHRDISVTVRSSKSNDISFYLAQLSDAMQPHREARADRLQARANWRRQAAILAERSPAEIERAAAWHETRAESQRRPLADQLGACGHTVADFLTPDGEIKTVEIGCGSRVCQTCMKRRAKRLARRVTRGAYAATIRERERRKLQRSKVRGRSLRSIKKAAKFKGRRLELVTLTCRHSGSVVVDLQLLARAWILLRARWYSKLGFSFDFSKFLEISEGTKHDGHAHFHALMWIPPVCWSWLNRAWSSCLNKVRAEYQLEVIKGAGNVDISRKRHDHSKVAAYATKAGAYVAKSALMLENLDPELAANLLDFLYGRRLFSSSQGFFVEESSGWELLEIRDFDKVRELDSCDDGDPRRPGAP